MAPFLSQNGRKPPPQKWSKSWSKIEEKSSKMAPNLASKWPFLATSWPKIDQFWPARAKTGPKMVTVSPRFWPQNLGSGWPARPILEKMPKNGHFLKIPPKLGFWGVPCTTNLTPYYALIVIWSGFFFQCDLFVPRSMILAGFGGSTPFFPLFSRA